MPSFAEIPSQWRVPLAFVEFDPSASSQGSPVQPYKAVIIGQRLAAGTVAELVPYRATRVEQVQIAFGRGSQIAGMAARWFQNNPLTEAWFIALDDVAGTAATKTVTVTGPATAAGTVYLYIGGRRYAVAVADGDTATEIADAIEVAVEADLDAYVTFANTAGVITLTAKNSGTLGSGIDVRINYNDGEALPAGVGVTIADGVAGATDPDLQDAIDAMGDAWFNVIVQPYIDTTSLTAIHAELLDRFNAMRAIDGYCYTASVDSVTDLGTLGDSLNSQFTSVLGIGPTPSPAWECAAVYGAVAALQLANDPARPLQTLQLVGILAPAFADRFTLAEQNVLMYDGITPTFVDAGGGVRLTGSITTYKTNALGGDDESYLELNTMATLSYMRYSLVSMFKSKYPRHKVANDGTKFAAGQAIITPKIARAECIALFRQWEQLGISENAAGFKAGLIVERNSQNPKRLDILLPPDLVNGLQVVAAQLQFRL